MDILLLLLYGEQFIDGSTTNVAPELGMRLLVWMQPDDNTCVQDSREGFSQRVGGTGDLDLDRHDRFIVLRVEEE